MTVSAGPRGLSTEEAARRREQAGSNRIVTAPPVGVVRQVLEQLLDPMIMVLLVAAALTVATGDRPDTIVIALVVVMNTAVGIVQHQRAEKAVAALRDLAPQLTTVVRDGAARSIAADDVVPGDLVLLAGGDVVPADGTLELANALTVDESAMTGESVPVLHAVGEELTAGTLVVRGRGELTVTATGADSGLGRLAAMVQQTPFRRTPLQERMRRLSLFLVVTVLALTVLVVVVGLVRGEGLVEMLVVGASLAVAAVPESLPAVMTVALATGAHRMAQRNAVVRRLSAVESLGSVTVIATDKTGTLTHGSLAVEHLWVPADEELAVWSQTAGSGPENVRFGTKRQVPEPTRRLVRDLALCNDAVPSADGGRPEGEPLEVALLELAARQEVDVVHARATWERTEEVPFDAETQTMTTVHRDGDRRLTVVKGAPERVLALVPEARRTAALAVADAWAADGCRVLAVARSDRADAAPEPGSMELAGLVAFTDPPREAAAGVVARCRDAGVQVVLVTGDHLLTARSIARRVGIPDEPDVSVFARVRPDRKVGIVEGLQSRGEVVAMLGDGVNDAPALKRADIGVAAGLGGTEVARQAADVVLLDDDLSTVAAAIEEGRRIFANLRAFLVYAVSGGLSEVAVMLLGPLVGMPLALLPSQILWINLLTHGLTGVAFSGEPLDPEDMHRPPVRRSAPVLERRHLVLLVTAAALLAVSSLSAGLVAGGGDTRTAVFVALGLGQLGVALALRGQLLTGFLRNPGLPVAVLASAALMLVPLTWDPLRDLLGVVPLTRGDLTVALAAALVPGLGVLVVRFATRARSPRADPVTTARGSDRPGSTP